MLPRHQAIIQSRIQMRQEAPVAGSRDAVSHRRYAHLCWLRQHSDFFTLEAIRFRHPSIYSIYIPQDTTEPTQTHSLTSVFQKSLLNHQYKQLLKEKMTVDDTQRYQGQLEPGQQEFDLRTLMVIVEGLFMDGKESEVNYQQIDANQQHPGLGKGSGGALFRIVGSGLAYEIFRHGGPGLLSWQRLHTLLLLGQLISYYMKYYETNRILAFTLFAFSGIGIALWIVLIVLHSVNNTWINIRNNPNFLAGYNACLSSFANIASGGLDFSTIDSNTAYLYGNLIVQNHQSYQLLSLIFLFMSGGFLTIVLVIAVFLLLKSRQPYMDAWFLARLETLKTSTYVFAFLAVSTAGIYWGYTFTFINLGRVDCVNSQLQDYAASYFINIILGGVLTGVALVVYFLTLGIRLPNQGLENKQLLTEQESRIPLQVLEPNVEAQRLIAQRLSYLPKINEVRQIEMVEQPPPGFADNYHSRSQIQSQQPPRSNYQPPQIGRNGTMYPQHQQNQMNQAAPQMSTMSPPKTPKQSSINHEGIGYYYVPKAHQPIGLQEIEVHIDDRLQNLRKSQNPPKERNNTDSRILQEAYMSPSKGNQYPNRSSSKNSASPSQKSRLKIFHRGSNASKQKSILSQLKSRYGYN